MFNGFNIFIVVLASGFLRSYFAAFVYFAWIWPILKIGPKLKFPRGRETLVEPIDLSYNILANMIRVNHDDDTLYFLALTELKNRILHKDATKQIATDKFFSNYRRNENY